MRPLRAILIAIFIWILIFVEVSILMIGLKLEGAIYYIIHCILLIPIALLGAFIYYKSRDRINGFVLGIFILLVANILDLIITVPIFVKADYDTLSAAYAGFYGEAWLWVGFLITIVIVGIYDLVRKK